MPTTYTLTGTLTSASANRTISMTVSTTLDYISLICDNTFAIQTNVAQTWTFAPLLSSVTPYNVNPISDKYFPVLLQVNSADSMGYLKITTTGAISFVTPTLPVGVILNCGIRGFNVSYDYL